MDLTRTCTAEAWERAPGRQTPPGLGLPRQVSRHGAWAGGLSRPGDDGIRASSCAGVEDMGCKPSVD